MRCQRRLSLSLPFLSPLTAVRVLVERVGGVRAHRRLRLGGALGRRHGVEKEKRERERTPFFLLSSSSSSLAWVRRRGKKVKGMTSSCSHFLSFRFPSSLLSFSRSLSLPTKRERERGGRNVDDPCLSGRGVSGAEAPTATARREEDDDDATPCSTTTKSTTCSIAAGGGHACPASAGPEPPLRLRLSLDPWQHIEASVDTPFVAGSGERERRERCFFFSARNFNDRNSFRSRPLSLRFLLTFFRTKKNSTSSSNSAPRLLLLLP